MIITVAGFKGGIGKTTTALHLAAFFSVTLKSERVLVVDGDPNQFCLGVSKRGQLPFEVCSLMSAPRASQGMEHIVIDTEGNPDKADIEEFSKGSDLVVLPCTVDSMAIEAVLNAVDSLTTLKRYGVVLTMIDSRQRSTTEQARSGLKSVGIPVFKQGIRRFVAYQKAALKGVPVYDVTDENARIAWGEYVALGKEIVSHV